MATYFQRYRKESAVIRVSALFGFAEKESEAFSNGNCNRIRHERKRTIGIV